MAQMHARTLTTAERDSLQRAVHGFEQVLEIAPDHPITLFDLGLCWYLLGEDDKAANLLSAATNHDRAPNRSNDVINSVVRELAARHPEVAFLDAERLWRARTPGGHFGYEIVMDNCHLQPGARRILMEDIAPLVLELASR